MNAKLDLSTLRQRISLLELGPRLSGLVVAVNDHLVEADGLNCPTGTAVRIERSGMTDVDGEVVGFNGGRSIVAPLSPCDGIVPGARVELMKRATEVACGNSLCGRVVDAQGRPVDGGGPIGCTDRRSVWGQADDWMARARVEHPLSTGIRAIDALMTMGVGQRIAVIAQPGVGKTVLTNQILDNASYDVAVVALVGERAREIADFVARRKATDAWLRTCVISAAADDLPLLRVRAAARATAVAEYFRDQGRHVLLIVDSLTRVANAQREIGLALGEPPTMRGYPPSTFSLIPRLVERAGASARTGGAITALYTVLTDRSDNDDPVAESVRAIADGHIVLSRQLAEQGVFPAIDVARSLSRVMDDIVDAEHLSTSRRFRALWSAYEANHELQLMGAYVAGIDRVADIALQRRPEMIEFVRQPSGQAADFAQTRARLVSEFGER